MPANDEATSVFRHGAEPREDLWRIARELFGPDARIYGAAVCKVRCIREQRLEVVADEPPPRHANIIGWPMNVDPEMQRAQQKELALVIASRSTLMRTNE
ncbi:MAG TPA: hypothetical protein VNM92_14345 [Thermoanaerobaculia bacterium]|nr:hypothetical protein [Thermoanaerobaculia bacterium]